MQKIIPNLWFADQAEEAANFYVSIFSAKERPGSGHGKSKILDIARYGDAGAEVSGMPKGSVMTATFELDGQEFIGINGGPVFTFTPAVSFLISCETQAEIDYFWEKLTEGGETVQCGWLKDKYGLSWQVAPPILDEMIKDQDHEKSERVMAAMIKMIKIDIEELKKAYEGK